MINHIKKTSKEELATRLHFTTD